MHFCPPKGSAGFNLIEVMVVLALMAIMATAAVSGLTSLVHLVRVKTASQSLFSTLLLARSEAAKRNAEVTITPIDGVWADGWDIASGGELILKQQSLRGVEVSLGPDVVTYTRYGRLPDGVATPQFQIQSTGSDPNTRCIEVDLSGRPRSLRGAC